MTGESVGQILSLTAMSVFIKQQAGAIAEQLPVNTEYERKTRDALDDATCYLIRAIADMREAIDRLRDTENQEPVANDVQPMSSVDMVRQMRDED
jgi:hypothetical protein